MRLESLKHLADLRDAGVLIQGFIASKSLVDFAANPLLRSGVQWQFAVIGEALTRIRREDPAVLSGITSSQQIIGFRNVLVHGYNVVVEETVWDVITAYLFLLLREVEALIESDEPLSDSRTEN